MSSSVPTAVILLGHGSRRPEANAALEVVARELEGRLGGPPVSVAFLQLARPTLADAVEACAAAGFRRVAVQPFFLFPGGHVLEDVPRTVDELRLAHPGIEILLAAHLGTHRLLADIAAERLAGVLA